MQYVSRGETVRSPINFDPAEKRAKDSFKDECDVNQILARFQVTGVIDHFAKHGGEYMDVPALDYQHALDVLIQADSMFADLPSSLRNRFENDPLEFLKFVQDPDNLDEMRELGLADPVTPDGRPRPPQAPQAASEEPSPPVDEGG